MIESTIIFGLRVNVCVMLMIYFQYNNRIQHQIGDTESHYLEAIGQKKVN